VHRVYRGAAHRNAHSVRDHRYREVGLEEVIATALDSKLLILWLAARWGSVNMNQLAQNAESHELNDALEELGEEATRLQTVIDTVPSILWTSFPDGSKEYLNKRWYEYTGLTQEQGKGWDWKMVVHPDDRDRLLRESLALVHARKPGELETRIRQYDGEYCSSNLCPTEEWEHPASGITTGNTVTILSRMQSRS
jgi:PAS domain S-box-containing protein